MNAGTRALADATLLAVQRRVGVAHEAVQLAAILEGVEGEVSALGQELADDRAGAAL